MSKALLFAAMPALFAAPMCCSVGEAADQTVWTREIEDCVFTAKTNCPNARAKVGDDITITLVVNSSRPGYGKVSAFENGIARGKPQLVKFGEELNLSFKAAHPGSVSVTCALLNEDKKPIRRTACGYFGVLIDPEKIVPGNPVKPADFDKFWAEKRAELDAVPVKATRKEFQLSPAEAKKYPDVACCDVKVDCAGNAPVSGILCMPRNAKPKSLPAIVRFHGAGVRTALPYPAYGRTAIVFDVNAHGIENGHPKKYYQALSKVAPLLNYRLSGWENHHENYYVGMLVRVMRALDYVKSLPEWDGKTLIAMGNSQGGAQALAAAGLDPQVSLCVATVPGLCDLGAGALKRRPGGPLPSLPIRKQRDPELIREAAYVDNVFFSPRIKCPVYLAVGLGDLKCFAPGICAFYNALPQDTPKHIAIHPDLGHHGPVSELGKRAIRKALEMK